MEKCLFFEDCINYSGHVIQPDRIFVSTITTNEIRRLQHPINVTDLKSSLVLCNIFRLFLPKFAITAAPLTPRLEEDHPFVFGRLEETEIEALESVQHGLLSLPIMSLPRTNRSYILDKDVCYKEVWNAQLQDQPGGAARPVGYRSRSLSKGQQAYDSMHREFNGAK